mgnify:CR=1 FL=1
MAKKKATEQPNALESERTKVLLDQLKDKRNELHEIYAAETKRSLGSVKLTAKQLQNVVSKPRGKDQIKRIDRLGKEIREIIDELHSRDVKAA